jgi:hypothetical protein
MHFFYLEYFQIATSHTICFFIGRLLKRWMWPKWKFLPFWSQCHNIFQFGTLLPNWKMRAGITKNIDFDRKYSNIYS